MGKSLLEIRTQIRQRLEMENSGFIKDSEFNSYINASMKELYDLMISAYGNDYFASVTPTVITTVAGQQFYDLPADFYKMLGVDLVLGANRIVKLKPFQFNERDKYQMDGYWSAVVGNDGPRYKITANKIQFAPTSSGAYTIHLWYVPLPPELVNNTDQANTLNGWEEYIILDVCIKAKNKLDLDPSAFIIQKKEIKERIEKMKEDRDAGMSFRVSDVNPHTTLAWEPWS